MNPIILEIKLRFNFCRFARLEREGTMDKSKLTTINLSLKQKEKDKVIQKAIEEGYGTTSSFLVDKALNQIKIEAVYNGFRELVIEVNRVGTNINQIIRDIQYNKYFSDEQIRILESELKKLNQFLRSERRKIKDDERYFMNFNFKDVENHLRIELDRHGKQIKINQIVDATNNLLVDFIDLLEKEKFEKMYVDYIYNFLEKLDHRKYDYREALDMFEDFNNQLRSINQKLLNPQNKIDGNDFKEVRNIMSKHRR